MAPQRKEQAGNRQGAFCLEVTGLAVKQKETLNICIAFLKTSSCGITWINTLHMNIYQSFTALHICAILKFTNKIAIAF